MDRAPTSRPPFAAPAAFFTAAILGLVGCASPLESEAQAGTAEPRVEVTVALAQRQKVTEFSEHSGHTESPSTVEIRARASGHLLRTAFHEGNLVKKGDLLFVVDPKPYEAALHRAQAELASVQVDQEVARKNAARATRLFQSGAISEQELDSQEAPFEQFAARARVATVAVSSATLDLDYAFIKAPIDGRIGRALVTPGNLVGPGTPSPLATLVSVDPLYVYLDVDEARALRLRKQSGAVARVGFADEDGYPHEARIDFLDNRVDPATGLLKVRAVIDNPGGIWMHGLFVRVRLPEQEAHDALLVADVAIGTDQDRRFVWVVGAGDKVERKTVKLGPLDSGLRIVHEGLEASDRVVVRGLQRLRTGAVVQAKVVAMNEVTQSSVLAGVSP